MIATLCELADNRLRPLYTALLTNVLLAWGWTIKNFDRLAGRAFGHRHQQSSQRLPVVPISKVAPSPQVVAATMIQTNLVVESSTETS